VIDMTSISALIDFLMSLMRDEDTKRSFEQNPGGTMADKGLHDVTAEDVRDARLIMADSGHARPRPDSGQQANGFHDGGLAAGGGNSAVREILHTTNTFEIDQTIVNVDNHRTTILDSFNSADKVTAIQDNDTVIDIDEDDGDDDTTEDKTENQTDTPDDTSDEPGDETDEPKDGDEQEPVPGPADELPSDPGPPPMDEDPGDLPSDPGPPQDSTDTPDTSEDVPFDDAPDPAPAPEPEAFADEPIPVEPDDLPVA
jgi:hypothetical protein